MPYRFLLIAAALVIATPTIATADGRLADYNAVDLSSWQPRDAASAMDLVAKIYQGHPESTDGRPGLKVEMRRDDDFKLVIDIELTGFLDDSVMGSQHRAIVSRGSKGWHLEALGQRNLCYRGSSPGKPTKKRCP